MKLRPINNVETLHATSLQYRIKCIFINKRYEKLYYAGLFIK